MEDAETLLKWLQKDIGEIKVRMDVYLGPFKKDIGSLKGSLQSTKANLTHALRVQDGLLLMIKGTCPEKLDEALSLMFKPSRSKNFAKFKSDNMFRLAKLEAKSKQETK
jgi:hypothetical protein